jgi:DNA-binding response OmpR family regulator
VRRSAGYAEPRITCGPLTFDAQTGVFELNGLPLRLTALEWRVLACLTLRKDVVIERSELNDRVYEGDADVDSNSLEVIVARLRRKIGHEMIETIRGRGYRLTCGNP